MSLNWNAFLTDEGLSLPNERWADPPRTTAGRSSDMTASSSDTARQSFGLGQDTDSSAFENALLGTGDPYFADTFNYNPNDYFLSDLEVLQPFGDTIAGENSTSESSPEPNSALSVSDLTDFQPKGSPSNSQTPASRSTQSPKSTSTKRSNTQRSQSYLNQDFTSMFSKQSETGFVEDLTFPNGPTGLPETKTTALDSASQNSNTETTVKRSKGKPDVISACWTSPLCPNHSEGGTPPNPSTCGGGCAPFLFDDTLPAPPLDSSLLTTDMDSQDINEGVVEIQSRLKKRTESESSREPSGRQFSKSSSADIQPRLKNESSNSPEEELAPLPEDKGKSRRRLPHNQVERKYRESLNTQLDSLRRVVPALQQNQRNLSDGADIEDLPAPSKPSKAVILASATAHIRQIEKDKKSLAEENLLLRQRVKALQALVKCDDCSLMQYVVNLKIQNPT